MLQFSRRPPRFPGLRLEKTSDDTFQEVLVEPRRQYPRDGGRDTKILCDDLLQTMVDGRSPKAIDAEITTVQRSTMLMIQGICVFFSRGNSNLDLHV